MQNSGNNTSEASNNPNDYVPDNGTHDFADYWGYRTVFFQDYDGSKYRLRLSIAINSKEDAAYNIGKINKKAS